MTRKYRSSTSAFSCKGEQGCLHLRIISSQAREGVSRPLPTVITTKALQSTSANPENRVTVDLLRRFSSNYQRSSTCRNNIAPFFCNLFENKELHESCQRLPTWATTGFLLETILLILDVVTCERHIGPYHRDISSPMKQVPTCLPVRRNDNSILLMLPSASPFLRANIFK